MSDNLAHKLANQEKIASTKNNGGANIPVQQKPGQDDFLDENTSTELRLQRMRHQAARNALQNIEDDEDEDESEEEDINEAENEDGGSEETTSESAGSPDSLKSRFGEVYGKNRGNISENQTGDETETGADAEKDGKTGEDKKTEGKEGDDKKDSKNDEKNDDEKEKSEKDKKNDENSDNKKDKDNQENKSENKEGEKKDDKADKNQENEPKTETDAEKAGEAPKGINDPESIKEQNTDNKSKKTGQEKPEKPDSKQQEQELKEKTEKDRKAAVEKALVKAGKQALAGNVADASKELVGTATKAGSQWALTVLWGSVWLDWTLLSLLGLNALLAASLMLPDYVCQFGDDYLLGKWFPSKDLAKITEIMILVAIDIFVISILLIFFLITYQLYNCGLWGMVKAGAAYYTGIGDSYNILMECVVNF